MPTIDSVLEDRYRDDETRTALRQKIAGVWQEVSYRELWSTADRVASGLIKRGFNQGERAALLAPSSVRWVSGFLGILRAGGVAVPVDKELKAAELRHVLADCGAKVVFTDSSNLDTVLECVPALPDLDLIVLLHGGEQGGAWSTVGQLWNRLRLEWEALVKTSEIPADRVERFTVLAKELKDIIFQGSLFKADESQSQDPFVPIVATRMALAEAGRLLPLASLFAEDSPPASPRTSADTAVILYTSGTTGRAKGAMLSHGNILSNLKGIAIHFQIDETIHTLSYLPINHVFELVIGVLLPLYMGGKISFAESLKKLGDNLSEVKPTFLLGVPAVYKMILERIRKNVSSRKLSRFLFALPVARNLVTGKVKKAFGSGTIFISGGAPLDPAIAHGLLQFGIPIFQGYGITETSPVISAEQRGGVRLGTVGRVIPEVEVRIADANEDGIGEILVRGPNIMLGYYNNPEASLEVLKDGWYHTGDLGSLDRDGYLRICGRVKNLIVTPNGKNVYPEEVENELLKSPYIAEVMVYGHKVDALAEEVRAVIFPNQEQLDAHAVRLGKDPLTLEEIEELIKEEVMSAGKGLADYKRVKRFTLREEEFPKTTTRKIKRFAVDAGIPLQD